MYPNVTNYNIHLNPKYRSSNPESVSQFYDQCSEQQLLFNSSRRLNDRKKIIGDFKAAARETVFSSSVASFNGSKISKYSFRSQKPTAVRVPKKNKYKWENQETKFKSQNLFTVTQPRIIQNAATRGCFTAVDNRRKIQKTPVNNIVEMSAGSHYRSSIPFFSFLSKGWFSRPPCDVSCISSSSFDLQSCCFISKQFLPRNTLNMNIFRGSLPISRLKTENTPELIKLSKHKLIRKTMPPQTSKSNSSLVLCTKRKLIREAVPTTVLKKQFVIPVRHSNQQQMERKNDVAESRLSTTGPAACEKTSVVLSPLIVLTNRKLVRRPVKNVNHNAKKSPVTNSPTKLIRLNPNKLIRSSLLHKYSKRPSSNNFYSNRSVLSQMIQHRRRPHAGSSYLLLSRNKLIRRVRYRNKVWKKQADCNSIKSVVRKRAPSKVFVSVGKNKLIRKSLFSKTNKNASSRNSISSISSAKNKLFTLMLNSPSRRVQSFTNHLSRRNLKYLASTNAGISRYRFLNKCKNNKRVLRKKNSVCPVYRRKGECPKDGDRRCPFIHDKKYISVCRNHMRGLCEEEKCLLSHDLIPQKLPVCLHFLNSSCENEHCPFLHVKLEPKAPICVQFLRGYCEAADKCTSWHVYACMQFKNSGKCDKGDGCRLPHRSLEYFEGKCPDSEEDVDENTIQWRYFEKNKLDDKDVTGVQIIPEKQSLGPLPDYIPF